MPESPPSPPVNPPNPREAVPKPRQVPAFVWGWGEERLHAFIPTQCPTYPLCQPQPLLPAHPLALQASLLASLAGYTRPQALCTYL